MRHASCCAALHNNDMSREQQQAETPGPDSSATRERISRANWSALPPAEALRRQPQSLEARQALLKLCHSKLAWRSKAPTAYNLAIFQNVCRTTLPTPGPFFCQMRKLKAFTRLQSCKGGEGKRQRARACPDAYSDYSQILLSKQPGCRTAGNQDVWR